MQNTILSSNVRFALFAIVFAPNKSEVEQQQIRDELTKMVDETITSDREIVDAVRQAQILAAGTTLAIPAPGEQETTLAQQLKQQLKAGNVNPHTLRAYLQVRASRYGNFGHNLVAVTVPADEATTLHPTYWEELIAKVERFHASYMGEFNTMTTQMVMGENPITVPAVPASIVTQKESLVRILQARDYASLRPQFGTFMIAWATHMATVARVIDTYATTAFQAIDTEGNLIEIDPTN